jgi:hypothetical protein
MDTLAYSNLPRNAGNAGQKLADQHARSHTEDDPYGQILFKKADTDDFFSILDPSSKITCCILFKASDVYWLI